MRNIDIDMISPAFAFNAKRLLDSRVNEIFASRFSYLLFAQGRFIQYFTNYGQVVFIFVFPTSEFEGHFCHLKAGWISESFPS